MTKVLKFLRSERFRKISAAVLLVVVICSFFTFSVSAEDSSVVYQTLAPISCNFHGQDFMLQAFPNTSGPEVLDALLLDSVDVIDYLISGDYTLLSDRIKYMDYGGVRDVPYIEFYLLCPFSRVTINGKGPYYGASGNSSGHTAVLNNLNRFVVSGVDSSYVSGSTYSYLFALTLYDLNGSDSYDAGYRSGLNEGYDLGFSAGKYSDAAKDLWYQDGYDRGFTVGVNSQDAKDLWYQDGYDTGYYQGRNSTDSENLGHNLLGDTLSAPMKALNQFTLYESSSGFTVTLGLVVGGAISLMLFIAFLKIFAGG